MSDNTMHNWLKAGYVPFVAQKKIELITESVLIAEWDCQELKGWKPKGTHNLEGVAHRMCKERIAVGNMTYYF